MNRHLIGAIATLLLAASPALAQQPTLVVENGRVITGDGPEGGGGAADLAGVSILLPPSS